MQFQYQNGTTYASQGGYNTFNVGTDWVKCEFTFTPPPEDAYRMIVESYKANVPEAQQSGITIWSLSDNEAEHEYWLKGQVPNLFDKDYKRKWAYKGFCDGIAGEDLGLKYGGEEYKAFYEKNNVSSTLSNIQEIKARGAHVLSIAKEGHREIEAQSNEVIYIPDCRDEITPLLSVVPLQLFSYYVAKERGCNIDKPKNLAKSVTVE